MTELQVVNIHINAIKAYGNSLEKGFQLFLLVKKKLEIEMKLRRENES